jgi:hypothetical protein
MPSFEPLFLQADDAATRCHLCKLEQGYLDRKPMYQAGSRFRGLPDSKSADCIALVAGKRIRDGGGGAEDLDLIFDWKNGGSRFWKKLAQQFRENSQRQRSKALARVDTAVKAKQDFCAVLCLQRPALRAVQVKTASAILACIYPEDYTVIDELALRAVGLFEIKTVDADFYCDYLNYCRALKARFNMSLRSLDRAFWEWGKTHAKDPRLHDKAPP